MFGWISRMLGNAAGIIDNAIRGWVGDLINGLYGFLHTVFADVGSAWSWFYRYLTSLYHQIGGFFYSTYIAVWHIIHNLISGVIRYAETLFRDAWNFIRSVLSYAYNVFQYALHYAEQLIRSAEQWVIRDIWNPLYRFIASAWSWITSKGETLWHYLTHPADFVDLIWDALIAKLEADAWRVGAILGRFFLSLIVHNAQRLVILIEDIFTSVL